MWRAVWEPCAPTTIRPASRNNPQLPIPNSQDERWCLGSATANSQLPKRTLMRWKLGVGSWELGVGSLLIDRPPAVFSGRVLVPGVAAVASPASEVGRTMIRRIREAQACALAEPERASRFDCMARSRRQGRTPLKPRVSTLTVLASPGGTALRTARLECACLVQGTVTGN